jgi:hypothetical protein
MGGKRKSAPRWFMNSYFWFAAILVIVGVIGLFGGDRAIRDPGQVRDSNLYLIYFGAALIMTAGGIMSHLLATKAYHETNQ